MAERNYKTHGIYPLTNCIGIAVSIINDDHVAYGKKLNKGGTVQ